MRYVRVMTAMIWLASAQQGLPESLSEITSLSRDRAHELIERFAFPSLQLNGLKVLEKDAADALACFRGTELCLNGLESIDIGVANALKDFKGRQLRLNGIKAIEPDAAHSLAQFKGDDISLNGLPALDAAAAKAFSQFKGVSLSFDGVSALDAETARCLAGFKGSVLSLNGVAQISEDVVKELRGVSCVIRFSGLRIPELSKAAVEAILRTQAFQLSPEQAEFARRRIDDRDINEAIREAVAASRGDDRGPWKRPDGAVVTLDEFDAHQTKCLEVTLEFAQKHLTAVDGPHMAEYQEGMRKLVNATKTGMEVGGKTRLTLLWAAYREVVDAPGSEFMDCQRLVWKATTFRDMYVPIGDRVLTFEEVWDQARLAWAIVEAERKEQESIPRVREGKVK